jgi:Tol biopolymer transport system component
VPTATSSLFEPELRQLTSGGCCTNPFWSADSRYVQFIDRPPSRSLGVYGVDVEFGGPPTLLSQWIVNTSRSGEFFVYPDGNVTVVQRASTGERYVIANGGRSVSVSPDGERLLWQVIEPSGDFDQRRSQTWVAKVDGSQARIVGETIGFGSSEWIDKDRILLVGLPLEDRHLVGIAALKLGTQDDDAQLVELAQVARPRGVLLSPDGQQLIYFLSFQSDSQDDGLWIVPTDGRRAPFKLGFFGSYRWRDGSHLLFVPMELGVQSHTLWEYDIANNSSRRLTDPARTTFRIEGNDWAVSPNGKYVVFVNATDLNLWLIDISAATGP